MSGRNLEDFFQDTEAFYALSDDDKARLYAGETLEGETDAVDPAEEISDAPAADPVVSEEINPAVVEPEPVVLAKDGQHTIPFSELEAARERNRQLEQELLALKSTQATQPPADDKPPIDANEPPAESNEDKLLRFRREEREAMFMGDTDLAEKLGKEADALNRQMAKDEWRSESAAQEAERQAKAAQEGAMADALRRADALVDKYQFLKPNAPTTNQDAIDLVLAQRDKLMASGVAFGDAIEQAVAKVAPLFDKTTTQQTNADVAQRAAAAISKAKNPVATSLSQAPAGSKPQHDEGEMMRNMDISRLSQTLENKSPEEIMRIMAKAL